MIVSIHQPQYIPWPGYFFKILHSDVFVVFDTVQYPRGKHFGNRNQVKTANGLTWLTVPVLNRSAMLSYASTPVELPERWAFKHWRTIELAYGRAPFFSTFGPALSELYRRTQWASIADLNCAFIQLFLDALGSHVRVVRSSELAALRDSPAGADLVLAILEEVRATGYITGRGEGSRRYVARESFTRLGIDLRTYHFKSPRYPQLWGEFVPDLSIVDMLANLGPDAEPLIQRSGVLAEWDV